MRYNQHQRLTAIEQIIANEGNLQQTSQELKIPRRTLQDWWRWWNHLNPPLQATYLNQWREWRNWREKNPLPPPPEENHLEEEEEEEIDTYAAYTILRNRMLRRALALSLLLETDDDPTQVARLAIALARLIDRLARLDELIPRQPHDNVIRHQYVDPYDGSIHDTPMSPPWSHFAASHRSSAVTEDDPYADEEEF